MSYTQGPWRVHNRPGKGYGKEFLVYTPKGAAFVGDQLKPDGVSIGAAKANAQLAAAAPDLLEALQAMLTVGQPEGLEEMARAAISKAIGDTDAQAA